MWKSCSTSDNAPSFSGRAIARAYSSVFPESLLIEHGRMFASKRARTGYLFRHDNVAKTARILQSLSSAEEAKVKETGELLQRRGCANHAEVETLLGPELLQKLHAAGLFDFNIVSNEIGEHCFITAPAAFHKYVSPLVDDSFDMAKAPVAALTYGMTARP